MNRHGAQEQRLRLLPRSAKAGSALPIPDPAAGSGAADIKTRFTREGDDIVVNGGKIFISDGDVAGLIDTRSNSARGSYPVRAPQQSVIMDGEQRPEVMLATAVEPFSLE